MRDNKKTFNVFYHSDKGNHKLVNQDSLGYRIDSVGDKAIGMFIICDGLGGLECGEVASGTVVTHMLNQFKDIQNKFHDMNLSPENILEECDKLLCKLNDIIRHYGESNQVQMGTTASVLILFNHQYYIAHIGDTRIYIYDGILKQLTEDHSVIAMEIRKGLLSKEQALTDPRRNVLTQCIGVNQVIEPYTVTGAYHEGDAFLLCSDGFRHVLEECEIAAAIKECEGKTKEESEEILESLVQTNMDRGEKDNISVMMVRA